MDQDQQNQREMLEEQLQWSKEQVRILDEMNVKLHEMKSIAEYALGHNLTSIEIDLLNSELKLLKDEYKSLEKKYYPVLH